MKVECRQCGKKFKGAHGVAIHVRRAHAGAGGLTPEPVTISSTRSVTVLVRTIYDRLDDATESLREIAAMAEELKGIVCD